MEGADFCVKWDQQLKMLCHIMESSDWSVDLRGREVKWGGEM